MILKGYGNRIISDSSVEQNFEYKIRFLERTGLIPVIVESF